MPKPSRKDLERERKILTTRRKLEGGLSPDEKQRLAWLEAELRSPPPVPSRVPDLSEDSDLHTSRSEDSQSTQIEAPPSRRRRPKQPLAAADLFSESVVRKLKTATGAKPIDLDALDRRKRASKGKPNHLTGPRRALVQLSGGLIRRGVLLDPHLDADQIALEPGGAGDDPPQQLDPARIETIHLMLPDGLAPAARRGRAIRVLLTDGKIVVGYSPDYTPDRQAFTVLPSGERYIERIFVFRRAVREARLEGEPT
jgi:hypothetical protein